MGSFPSIPQLQKEGVFINGLHAAYPATTVDDDFLQNVIPSQWLSDDRRIAKLHAVNKRTGIKSRSVILDSSSPFYSRPEPYKVEELTEIWLKYGIPLSERACLGALADWGGSTSDITHLVAATCSIQSHPGIDAYIAQKLNLSPNISRTLLTGVGCAGGAALLRTAYEMITAMTFRNQPARVLVFACDLNSLGFRAELERLRQGHFPIGLALFSDAAAAAVICNDIGLSKGLAAQCYFSIQRWINYTVPDTLTELQLMPTSIGKPGRILQALKVHKLISAGAISTISERLPQILADSVRELFFQMISSMPELTDRQGRTCRNPCDFDWDLHPGGLGIFERIIDVMGLTRDHASATIITYENWGNSAGPTLFKVLDVRKSLPMRREYIVCCGFGNNVDITMLVLRRL